MNDVPGSNGYEKVVETFARASLALDFDHINADFLRLLPPVPARVLDAGAGVGQNAAALARRGYSVQAIEPLQAFLNIAQAKHKALDIKWSQDSLPSLESISAEDGPFDFILLDGVWHHLDPKERRTCVKRLAELLSAGGVCAISLRNGPAGAGKHVFPAPVEELLALADAFNLSVVLKLENQPSKMQNKLDVTWSRIALQRVE